MKLALLCAAALVAMWMCRWEVVAVTSPPDRPSYAIELDRLTGHLYYIQGTSRIPVDDK